MSDEKFEYFDDFWPSYLAQHSDPTNRLLHALGTSAALATVGVALVKRKPKLLALAALLGYGPAWVGHYLVEGNQPATLKNPLWSLRGDLRMLRLMATDELDEEILRLVAEGRTTPKMLEYMLSGE